VPSASGSSGAIAFTDIVGFTQFTAERGDDDALRLLNLQDQLVRTALPSDARIVKELGDGLLLWFPSVPDAIETCLSMRDDFERAATEDTPLWVRMGMHWGCPTARGDDLVGHDVNLAARIVDVAGPGELLVSEDVREQVGGQRADLQFEELGPVVMKGIPRPVGLFRTSRA
jgi:adenylate cyclase